MAESAKLRANRASAKEAGSFLDEYMRLDDELLNNKMTAMANLKAKNDPVSAKQADLLEDAKSQGVPKGLIKALAKQKQYEKKAREAMLDRPDEEKQFGRDIREAMGDFADTPLGGAAVEAEKKPDQTTRDIIAAVENDEAAKTAAESEPA